MIKIVRVSEKGQIAIPLEIREELGIKQGDDLLLFQADGKLIIEKTKSAEKRMRNDLKQWHRLSESAIKKVWDNKEDEKWAQELLKLNKKI